MKGCIGPYACMYAPCFNVDGFQMSMLGSNNGMLPWCLVYDHRYRLV